MTDEEELQLPDVLDDLDVEAALYRPPVTVPRVARTPATAQRFAFLKTKKLGEVWYEGDHLYRKGPCGITVYDSRFLTGYRTELSERPTADNADPGLLAKIMSRKWRPHHNIQITYTEELFRA